MFPVIFPSGKIPSLDEWEAYDDYEGEEQRLEKLVKTMNYRSCKEKISLSSVSYNVSQIDKWLLKGDLLKAKAITNKLSKELRTHQKKRGERYI